MDESDGQIVARVLGGDRDAYALLVERYADPLAAAAYARTGHRETARDLAQEAFVEGYRRLGELAEPERFAAWLFAICRHRAVSWVRHRAVERDGEDRERRRQLQRTDAADPLRAAADAERRTRLLRLVDDLGELDREILLLRFAGDLGRTEAARALGVSPATADKRLQRALARLREAWDRDGGDTP